MPKQLKPSTSEKIKTGAKKVEAEVKSELNKIPPTSDSNLLAAFSYAWLLSVVLLVVKRNDENVQFHAKQGTVLFLGSLLGFIPLFGWLVAIACWVGMIVGFIMAWQGKRYQIPLAYRLSQKIKL